MNVLLVDDHPLFLDGLKNMLTARGVEVVGVARDGLEAVDKARLLQPDVILMDIQMPHCDGLTATRQIKAALPSVQIVMLTMSSEDSDLFEAIKSGASGYLLKSQDTDEFFALLEGLTRGEAPLSPGLAGRILQEFGRRAQDGSPATADGKKANALPPRQLEVLSLVASGLSYKEVGARVGISERTVKYHMGEIVQRLHLENRAQVIEYVRRMGLVK
jgi:DNA-binding NarL/FixJ family response regulator